MARLMTFAALTAALLALGSQQASASPQTVWDFQTGPSVTTPGNTGVNEIDFTSSTPDAAKIKITGGAVSGDHFPLLNWGTTTTFGADVHFNPGHGVGNCTAGETGQNCVQ